MFNINSYDRKNIFYLNFICYVLSILLAIDLKAFNCLQLLKKDVEMRLGVVRRIQNHIFFSNMDWAAIEKRQVAPPFKPNIVSKKILLSFLF